MFAVTGAHDKSPRGTDMIWYILLLLVVTWYNKQCSFCYRKWEAAWGLISWWVSMEMCDTHEWSSRWWSPETIIWNRTRTPFQKRYDMGWCSIMSSCGTDEKIMSKSILHLLFISIQSSERKSCGWKIITYRHLYYVSEHRPHNCYCYTCCHNSQNSERGKRGIRDKR